jgi:hypothetical protein
MCTVKNVKLHVHSQKCIATCTQSKMYSYMYTVIYRAGQNLTYKNTAYPDTPYNRIRVWKFATVSISVWPYMGFGRPYIYAVCLNRVWTILQGGAGYEFQQQQSFLLFSVNFIFSRLFLLSASLFCRCLCFALINSYIGGYGWTLFCTGKGLSIFLCRSPWPFIFGYKTLGHAYSDLQELQNDPLWSSFK